LTLENFRKAQHRYVDRLSSYIPSDARAILDVGCGTGALAQFLLSKGYAVEALSPCEHQEMLVRERLGPSFPFYRKRFEDFRAHDPYDLILMSESAQYIKLPHLFKVAGSALTENGYLLVADYFRLQPLRYYRNCRVESYFMAQAEDDGFCLVASEDITESVLPTIELGRHYFDRFAVPLIDIAQTYLRREFPRSVKLARFFFRRQIDKLHHYLFQKAPERLDTEKFQKAVTCKILLFKKDSPLSTAGQ
jgi:SAM-dependent methyltransferase